MFRVARAEDSGLAAESVDLVTVAQALHWFDIDAFFSEAQRVLRPGGVLAFWCYQNCIVDPEVDPVVLDAFAKVDDYWPPERTIVEEEYPHIEMPFADIEAGEFRMLADWTAAELLGYMRTWSATQRYLADRGNDPMDAYDGPLGSAWGDGRRTVQWPIILRAGRK